MTLPVPSRSYLLSALAPPTPDVPDLHRAASLAWTLGDETLRTVWCRLRDNYGISQTAFSSRMCITQGNFARFLSGIRFSRFMEGIDPPIYRNRAERNSIVAWLILPWYEGYPSDLAIFRRSVGDYCCGLIDSIYASMSLALLAPSPSVPSSDQVIPVHSSDPTNSVQLDPLGKSGVVTPDICSELLIAHYHRIVTSDMYRLILFVDSDNVGYLCRSLAGFIPPDTLSVLVVSFMNKTTYSTQVHISRPWLIGVGIGTNMKGATDIILSMEIRSCIDYLIWNSETLRASRQTPLYIVVASADRIFSLTAHSSNSLLNRYQLKGAVTCQQWDSSKYSIPLCLMLQLPGMQWTNAMAPVVALCRELRETNPSSVPLSLFDTLVSRLSTASFLPHFVSEELLRQKVIAVWIPSSPTDILSHDLESVIEAADEDSSSPNALANPPIPPEALYSPK